VKSKHTHPSSWFLRFFRWYCHPDYQEDIEGDLLERFEENVEEKGIRAAKWRFIKDVLLLFRPGIIRSFTEDYKLSQIDMYKNYFIIAFRRLRQQLLLATLKIGGLGISFCAVILMLIYINSQWQYDRFHANGDQIYRVQTDLYKKGDLVTSSAISYSGVGPLMKNSISGIQNQVRLGRWIGNDVVFQYENNSAREQDFFFVDPSFLQMFSFELILGNPVTALSEPNSVVLTEQVATKLFGDADPIGKQVAMESRKSLKVTGIIKPAPSRSHIKFQILASYATLGAFGFDSESVYGDNNLSSLYTYTYVQLDPFANPDQMASQLSNLVMDRKKEEHTEADFLLQPLRDIHLYSNLQYELKATGNGKNIWTLLGISLLILALAWANYFNISTATTLDQSKSLGIRKVIGASKAQVVSQLCIENLMYSSAGLMLGLLMSIGFIPMIERAFHLPLQWSSIAGQTLINPLTITLIFIVAGTSLSALLPAFAMSSIRPIHVFRKSFDVSRSGLFVRRNLILLQFTIILSLLTANIAILKQTHYMQDKDPGIDLSNTLVVKGPLGTSSYENLTPSYSKFLNELSSISMVSDVVLSHQTPGNSLEIVHEASIRGKNESVSLTRDYGTASYFESFGLQFVAGGVPKVAKESGDRVVINEAAMHLMGFNNPEEALNEQLIFWEQEHEIIGVVKDYHHLSVHHPVAPAIFEISVMGHFEDGYISIKMNESDYQKSISQIKKSYESAFPNTVFEYFDLEEHYSQQYKADNDFKVLNMAFTGLALFISCVGLFGLSLIITNKRFKEIAIRKVLGSSVNDIVSLLSMQYVKLIAVAWIISIPISWFALDAWLQNFTYRISIQWWIFVVSFALAMVISLLTTFFNSIKAAVSNPLDSLKSE